jgi:frataxin
MPKEAEQGASATAATDISLEQYHQVSDDYLDNILAKLEHLQEEREGVDVEFSVCFGPLSCRPSPFQPSQPPRSIHIIEDC